jgi:site-specific DNA recombinase
MRTAAIYARVACVAWNRPQGEQTIASQTSALRAYAAKHAYLVLDGCVFEDEGWSGATLVRPGLQRLRDLVAQGQIETVLAYGPDRLSRRYADQVLLLEEFARHGADVVFLHAPRAATPAEVVLLPFQGMIAGYEKAEMRARTRRASGIRPRRGLGE